MNATISHVLETTLDTLSTTPESRPGGPIEHTLLTIVWIVTAVFSLILNSLCIIVVWKSCELNGVCRLFLTTLTVCDILLCISFVIPAIGVSITGVWPFGRAGCIVQILLIYPPGYTGFFAIAAINVDRYLAIAYPFKHITYVTFRRSVISLILFEILFYVYVVVMGSLSHWKVLYVPGHMQCSFSASLEYFWYLAIFNIVGLVPICVLIVVVTFVYVHILIIVRRHKKQIAGLGVRQEDDVLRNSEASTTYLLLSISMLIGYVPYVIVSILHMANIPPPSTVILLTRICFAWNGCLNVVIYFMRNKTLKRNLDRFLKRHSLCTCCYKKERNQNVAV